MPKPAILYNTDTNKTVVAKYNFNKTLSIWFTY